jgi:hypothetical protein
MVMSFIREHRGEVYFPWNPLEHLLVEGKYYHFDYGLYDRELAGFAVSPEHFRSCTPQTPRLVCFPENANFQYALKYLTGYSQASDVKELPGFFCYRREEVP